MNRVEAKNLLIVLRDAYPTWKPDIGAVVDTWTNALNDVAPADALEAADRHIAECSYPPSPADIRAIWRRRNPAPGHYELRDKSQPMPPRHNGPEAAAEFAKMRQILADAKRKARGA